MGGGRCAATSRPVSQHPISDITPFARPLEAEAPSRKMSFYFVIIGTKDNPLFEVEFGTSKGSSGDGIARFHAAQRHKNQFIVHSALDLVEEVQWASGAMYLRHVDRHQSSYVSAFVTGANTKFMLLCNPDTHSVVRGGGSGAAAARVQAAALSSYNPTAPAVEESVKNFFLEVYDAWVKTIMSPFYSLNMPVRSPVFRARVMAAARKYL